MTGRKPRRTTRPPVSGSPASKLGHYGRWAFAEFTEVYRIEAGFNKLIDSVTARPAVKGSC
jgi:hypothetical protein